MDSLISHIVELMGSYPAQERHLYSEKSLFNFEFGIPETSVFISSKMNKSLHLLQRLIATSYDKRLFNRFLTQPEVFKSNWHLASKRRRWYHNNQNAGLTVWQVPKIGYFLRPTSTNYWDRAWYLMPLKFFFRVINIKPQVQAKKPQTN